MTKEHCFKTEERVLVPAVIISVFRKQGCADVYIEDGAGIPVGRVTFNLDQIHPATREGEYRLTEDDLAKLCKYFLFRATVGGLNPPAFPPTKEKIKTIVGQWLENRKEAQR